VSDLDMLQEVLDADFVMLSYSTLSLYKMSNGFSQSLLNLLIQKQQTEQPVRLPQCDSPTTEQLTTAN